VVVARPAPTLWACHCDMCRRWSGGLVLGMETDALGVTISGPVTTYASSDIAERGFCSTCGTALWVRDIKTADTVIDLMPGLFENACGAVLDHEAYADRCPDGYALAGTHARVSKAEYERSQPHV